MSLTKKKGFQLAAAASAIALLAACSSTGNNTGDGGSSDGSSDNTSGEYITVVKLTNEGWFDRMEVGVEDWSKREGIPARMDGPAKATPELQVQLIESLIAQAPAAITVVPNSIDGLENVLKKAMDAGIVVIGHEGQGLKNVHADIEAFENSEYGKLIFENIAQCMGGEGKYVGFVGQLTAISHMEWVNGGEQLRKEKYPNIVNAEGDGVWIEAFENEDTAYQKTKELLQADPTIKGFQGSASTDVAGIGRAIQELGLQDSTCVMGTSVPSTGGKYLEDGSVDKLFLWDPALAGEAQLAAAKIFIDGGTIEEGTDLGVEGYNSLVKHPDFDNVWLGNSTLIIDKDNVNDFKF